MNYWTRLLRLKLAVGFMEFNERMQLHLEEKIVDLNLVVHPDLTIMDGRVCFVLGGPACGSIESPVLFWLLVIV